MKRKRSIVAAKAARAEPLVTCPCRKPRCLATTVAAPAFVDTLLIAVPIRTQIVLTDDGVSSRTC